MTGSKYPFAIINPINRKLTALIVYTMMVVLRSYTKMVRKGITTMRTGSGVKRPFSVKSDIIVKKRRPIIRF